MRDFIKSTLRFSWAMALFGVQQVENTVEGAVQPDNKTTAAFDSVTETTQKQLAGVVKDAFNAGDQLQSRIVDTMFGASGEQPPATGGPDITPEKRPVNSGKLNTSTFMVLGEGLAAGMGDFSLSEDLQRQSFPAQMARQMQTDFPLPLFQAPGISYPVGFTRPPVLVSQPFQTTVVDRIPPVRVRNLSVPGLTVRDAFALRPVQPLVQRDSHKLTALNLTLGLIHIAHGMDGAPPTQLEYALECSSTFALLALGYHEALEAAVKGSPHLLPPANVFRADYARLVAPLVKAKAEVVVITIPDPLDTAYFSSLEVAAKILKVDPSIILKLYGVRPDDLITVHGLNEIGFQLFGKNVGPLPANATLKRDVAQQISRRVAELDDVLNSVAAEHGARVYDLRGFLRRLKSEGVDVGSRRLTSEYLGGFYSLNGYYPGATGHALIANELLSSLNTAYGSEFPQVDVGVVSQSDPVAAYRQAQGPCWTVDSLPRALPANQAAPDSEGYALSGASAPGAISLAQQPSGWEELGQPQGEAPPALTLPPGLEQTLPLSKAASYFGDGIGAVNCRDPQGIQWGTSGRWLFGGLAMVDSHLSGNLRIKFSPPVNNVTRFEVSFPAGLAGDDAVLTTPQYFKMWFQQARVDEVPGAVSSGNLDLANGFVSDLKFYTRYSSSALFALVSVNPTFPRVPITFPGQYGSAWARFEQRDDGLLDFTFYGSTYAPLGPGIVWPLNFVGPSGQFATVPAAGTAMHPHLHLSTKALAPPGPGEECPEIPFNTIQELTLFSHNSSFGDAFTLNAPELGGKATGRSHLLGRALLQFGVRSGNSVSVAVSCVTPGGVMTELAPSPITAVFPGRLHPGPIGFDEILRFPLRTYSLDDLAILDDTFDISAGSVDLRSGRFINELLHRGFINQDLIFALIRVEPRTPGSSFFFRGPARLEKGPGGKPLFRYKGEVFIPYPEGFLFPSPNLSNGFPIGPNSRLDPFLWLHAIPDHRAGDFVKSASATNITSSTGEQFSYRFSIPNNEKNRGALFEYENHSQQGKFRMHSLAWVGFSQSKNSRRQSRSQRSVDYDTLSFTCFGVWTKDGVNTLLQASAQFSTSPQRPYVGIQVDSGLVSNVNTKPPNINDALP